MAEWGFAFLLFRRSIRRSFHGVNFELPVDQFRGKKEKIRYVCVTYTTMVERWIFMIMPIDKVGELEIFIRAISYDEIGKEISCDFYFKKI